MAHVSKRTHFHTILTWMQILDPKVSIFCNLGSWVVQERRRKYTQYPKKACLKCFFVFVWSTLYYVLNLLLLTLWCTIAVTWSFCFSHTHCRYIFFAAIWLYFCFFAVLQLYIVCDDVEWATWWAEVHPSIYRFTSPARHTQDGGRRHRSVQRLVLNIWTILIN